MLQIKQVIIVREDLKKFGISVGKLAVQIAHGAVEGYRIVDTEYPSISNLWISQGQKKIVLKVKALKELIALYNKARDLSVPCAIIRDAGLTELPPGTITVLVLGPWYSQEIDKISGSIPLLRDW